MALAAGARLGPYEIVSPLGAGGMGEVYRAVDTRLERTVAVKIVSAARTDDPEWQTRFRKEARAISSLNHPNICTLHDIGQHDGTDFLVMEYLVGETLADRLRRGALGLEEALRIAVHIANALDEAHEHGLIHRDIKPANVFLTTKGDAKILDFGLARSARPGRSGSTAATTIAESSTLTALGVAVGTIPYMSPEQLRGLPVDHRTDVFSFGVVLYEMITGDRPFDGASPIAVADAILQAPPRDLPRTLPEPLKAVIRRLLDKEPAHRHGSAKDICTELRSVEVSLTRTRKPLRRTLPLAAVAITLSATAFSGLQWYRSSRQQWVLETAAPEIARLVERGEYVRAAALTREARSIRADDPTLERLWTLTTGAVSIGSKPSEADVSLRSYGGNPDAWEPLGKTPIDQVRVPRSPYVWRVSKPGFAPEFFVAEPPGPAGPGYRNTFARIVTLRPEGDVPPGMLAVSAGGTGLGHPLGPAPAVQVEGFLIDRHEVTNEEYKRFVDAGGYSRHEFWKQPFIRNGRRLSWMRRFRSFATQRDDLALQRGKSARFRRDWSDIPSPA